MGTEFGQILRHHRKDAQKTQTDLVNVLRSRGYEKYSVSDVSKWDNGHRIPPEDVVDELEDALQVPEGLMLRAAGYLSAADYRRMTTGKAEMERQQAEHIASVQELAKSFITSLKRVPIMEKPNMVDGEYVGLLWVIYELPHHARWPMLKAHLGSVAADFESKAKELEGSPLAERDLQVRVERLRETGQLAQCPEITAAALYGDTKEWTEWGLNATCPWCSII